MKCPFLKKTIYNYPEIQEEHGPAMVEDRSQNPISIEEDFVDCKEDDCHAFQRFRLGKFKGFCCNRIKRQG